MKYPGKRMRCLIKPLGIIHNSLPGNCLNLMINLVTTSAAIACVTSWLGRDGKVVGYQRSGLKKRAVLNLLPYKRGARTQDTTTAFAGYGTSNRTPALVRYKNESINRLLILCFCWLQFGMFPPSHQEKRQRSQKTVRWIPKNLSFENPAPFPSKTRDLRGLLDESA